MYWNRAQCPGGVSGVHQYELCRALKQLYLWQTIMPLLVLLYVSIAKVSSNKVLAAL
jgi:hypothetical protein